MHNRYEQAEEIQTFHSALNLTMSMFLTLKLILTLKYKVRLADSFQFHALRSRFLDNYESE